MSHTSVDQCAVLAVRSESRGISAAFGVPGANRCLTFYPYSLDSEIQTEI